MTALSINPNTIQLTIVQRNIKYQTMILQVSSYSGSIKSTSNQSISSAFPSVQNAKSSCNISAHDCTLNQSTYITTNNCSKKYQQTKPRSCKSPTTQAALYLHQINQFVQHLQLNSMLILSQYICA